MILSPDFLLVMFEFFVGDVVYYTTADQMLAKDKIKSIVSQRKQGKGKHQYLLFNGLSKAENELFLSIKRAKAHFERCKLSVIIPKDFELE